MSRWLAAAFALLLLAPVTGPVTAGIGPDAAGAPSHVGTSAPGPDLSASVTQQRQFDRTTFVITTVENGSARWTFRFTRVLDNETDQENFEAFAADFNENETDLYTDFRDRARRLTAQGAEATDRPMEALAFSKRAFVTTGATADQGVVEMSFRWRGFAETNGDRVLIGDVFEGGLYLDSTQSLRIEAGPNLAFDTVEPEPDAQSPGTAPLAEADTITWEGEREFAHLHPAVELAPPGVVGSDGGGLGMLPMVGGAIVVLLGIGLAVAWRRGVLSGSGGGLATAGGADSEVPGPTGEVAGEPAVADEELLTDESRVLRLLEDNGGRMKQVNIVDETGWSKSKVSMLLSDMEEDDQISKLRVGRENVVSLKGHEPAAARSPFDDDEDTE